MPGAVSPQSFSQFQACHPWHVMVQDQAPQPLHFSLQELRRGSECRGLVSDHLQQEPQRIPYGSVIIDNGYRRLFDFDHV